MEIIRKGADGSNQVPRRSPAARRLPFDFIPNREVLTAVVGDRDRDCLRRCLSEEASASRQVVRRRSESGDVKLGLL